MSMTKGTVLKYTLLPGVMPRAREFLTFGLTHVAFYVAMIFEAVKILPRNHIYLNPENFGKYTISQVLAQTFKYLRFDRKHMDQVFIFGTILFGVVLFFMQILLLVFSLLLPAAEAAIPATMSQLVGTQYPQDDIAFMLLDRVFGIEDFFNSRVSNDAAFPFPYHEGLHILFNTYSTALVVVALVILTYFVTTIIAETITDGTAFGKRMNRVWAPIRLVFAFGLLIPIASGLNSGQYIVLAAAKWGSGLATNALIFFYDEIDENQTPFGAADTLIARPNLQDVSSLAEFLFVARACQYSETFGKWLNGGVDDDYRQGPISQPDGIQGYLLTMGAAGVESEAVFSATGATRQLDVAEFAAMLERTNYGSMIFVFGHKDDAAYANYPGHVKPNCGVLTMPVIAPDDPMVVEIQAMFLNQLLLKWHNLQLIQAAGTTVREQLNTRLHDCNDDALGRTWYPNCEDRPLTEADKTEFVEVMNNWFNTAIDTAIDNHIDDIIWCGPEDDEVAGPVVLPNYLYYGWAGAAICYNKIAQVNGAVTSAIANVPSVGKYPDIMEYVFAKRQAASADVSPDNRFNPSLPNGQDALASTGRDRIVHEGSYAAYRKWIGTGAGTGGTQGSQGNGATGHAVRDIINFIFGTGGLFNMLENNDIHPLAQLASAGRGLIEAAIRNIGSASGGIVMSAIPGIGAMANVASGFMLTFATIGLSAGFVLFYIVPFLPFIYFFFAVGGWIKGIFEAMVGVPLWALAHLRIDGDGFSGQAALNGYYLIFEIFLRPILILFGLLASTIVFAALVRVLNEIWSLVVFNFAGYDALNAEDAGFPIDSIQFWRAPIDEFFYTITYTIVVYMIGLSCFKLIDLVPNNLLRWIGHSVQAFGEMTGDPAAKLSQSATVGFSATTDKVTESMGQVNRATSTVGDYHSLRGSLQQQGRL